jgi:threonine synthase
MPPDQRLARELVCSRTGVRAPLDAPAFLSPAGAPWLVDYALDGVDGERLREAWSRRAWSMWRYRELLPHADDAPRVDLGEGGTPLVRLQRFAPDGIEVCVKQEAGNPTGSFKDRGLAMAVHRARELGAPGVELPSAGNAALALTAFAAASGMPCRVAVPEDTPAGILERCRRHGATVLTAPGTLVEAAALLSETDEGYWNLSTLKEPYRAEGKKTMGLELAEQYGWRLPDWIVYPTGAAPASSACSALSTSWRRSVSSPGRGRDSLSCRWRAARPSSAPSSAAPRQPSRGRRRAPECGA